MGDLLSLDSVAVKYGSVTAVHEISLKVRVGEVVALLGANGAGKTSTLHAIMGVAPVTHGRIEFAGTDITNSKPEKVVRSGIALSPEGRKIFARLLVRENLRLAAGSVSRQEYQQRLDQVLSLFPILREKLDSYGGELSGGQQQMLAISRALMSRPRLLLLDEPSLGLAPRMTAEVFELIARLAASDITILLVEQNVERALALSTRGYVLGTGRLLMEGDARSLAGAEIEAAYLGVVPKRDAHVRG